MTDTCWECGESLFGMERQKPTHSLDDLARYRHKRCPRDAKSWQERYCEDYTAKLKTSRCECGHGWNNAGMHFCSRFGSITEWEVANREAAGVYDDTTEGYPI